MGLIKQDDADQYYRIDCRLLELYAYLYLRELGNISGDFRSPVLIYGLFTNINFIYQPGLSICVSALALKTLRIRLHRWHDRVVVRTPNSQ